VDDIIVNKDYWFHKQQVHPSISRCMNGNCDEYLCQQLDEEFVSAADAYISGDNKKDPVIGKMVKTSEHGFVSFRDPDGDNHELNLNWKRLHNMAMPIVDFQLSWKTKPV
jgi:hypothetical protein